MFNLVEMYVDELMSIPEISFKTGIPRSNVRYALKKAGVLRKRSDAIRISSDLGKLGSGLRGKKRVFTEEWKKNLSESKKRSADLTAKGTSLKPSGYLEITRGENKGRSQHVVIMEEFIGRRLYAHEVVHHIDEDKTNNSIDNLKLMTRSEHARHHAIELITNRERRKDGKFK